MRGVPCLAGARLAAIQHRGPCGAALQLLGDHVEEAAGGQQAGVQLPTGGRAGRGQGGGGCELWQRREQGAETRLAGLLASTAPVRICLRPLRAHLNMALRSSMTT